MSSSNNELSAEAQARLAAIKLFAMDVDGTLTDGRVIYMEGQECQNFDVVDGQGLVWMRRAGVKLAWITGRGCEATTKRAEELCIDFNVLRCRDKRAALHAIQEELGILEAETLSMGDDLPDLALANGSGFFCAPANARPEVIERADFVTMSVGGRGAARELCELYLRVSGQWQAIASSAGR